MDEENYNFANMDKEHAIELVERYIRSASEKYVISQAVLFGSFAKGTNHADSDIDVALVMVGVADIFDAQVELMKLRRPIDLHIEPHPFRIEDFDASEPMFKEILRDGIVINL